MKERKKENKSKDCPYISLLSEERVIKECRSMSVATRTRNASFATASISIDQHRARAYDRNASARKTTSR